MFNRAATSLMILLLTACGDSESMAPSPNLPEGTADAVSLAACEGLSASPDLVTSALDRDSAIQTALVSVERPALVMRPGGTSYVALDVPSHHTDYAIYAVPAGSVVATSTTNLPDETLNASCPEEGLGELRLHIHEFDHSVLTLEGEGEVWLYFRAVGDPGHGHDHDDHGHSDDDHDHEGNDG
ncbi:MAG: hypothetical protein AAGF92_15960 [Myxococcota bacterium]